jgi:hypothetical protein
MDYTTANKIMAEIHLRRDWTLVWHRVTATTMFVEIKGIVDNSSDYPRYERKSIATTEFVMHLDQLRTPMDLIDLIMAQLLVAARHEEREFLRVGPNWVAPFHPHTPLGQRNWSRIQKNLTAA